MHNNNKGSSQPPQEEIQPLGKSQGKSSTPRQWKGEGGRESERERNREKEKVFACSLTEAVLVMYNSTE